MKKILMGAFGGLMMVGAVANADSLYIDASGNVGIGTNTPNKIVHVVGPSGGPEAKRVFGLVIDFGTSQSPKSTRPLTTYWCPSRPGHQALRN
ncbi:hypothetical protein, partial [Thiolapillus sp.]|uniref:hypothetical protein n=1 Tax=Thiolapillus sp. TaxID=2017437 RepID=UPI003AF74ED6